MIKQWSTTELQKLRSGKKATPEEIAVRKKQLEEALVGLKELEEKGIRLVC
jgi:hypothetical protein